MLCTFYHNKKLCNNNIDSVYINNLEIMDLNLVGFLSLLPKDIGSANRSKVLPLNIKIPIRLSSNSHSTSWLRPHYNVSQIFSVSEIISAVPQGDETEALCYKVTVNTLVSSQWQSPKQIWRLLFLQQKLTDKLVLTSHTVDYRITVYHRINLIKHWWKQ